MNRLASQADDEEQVRVELRCPGCSRWWWWAEAASGFAECSYHVWMTAAAHSPWAREECVANQMTDGGYVRVPQARSIET